MTTDLLFFRGDPPFDIYHCSYPIYEFNVSFLLYCNQLAGYVKLAGEHRVIVGVSKLFYLQCIPKV